MGPADTVEILSGTVTYNASDFYTIKALYVAPGATLDIVGGTLTVLNGVDDYGTIIVDGDPPTLTIGGKVTVESGGKILAVGCDSLITIANGELDNSGIVAAKYGGIINFYSEQVTNESGTKIVADDGTITFEGGGVTNDGLIEAVHRGEIVFASIGAGFNGNPIDVTNSVTSTGGTIKATDYGTIEFLGDSGAGSVNNDYGVMEATHHGTLLFDDIAVANSDGAVIEAKDHGKVIIKGDGGPALTDGHGTIAAIGWGSAVDIVDNTTIYGAVNNPDGSFTYNVVATLEADGGTLFVSCDSSLYGPINVEIGGGGIADFANVLNANAAVTVAFCGPGTLELRQLLNAGETPVMVSGFGKGDTIDLTNLPFTTSGEILAYDTSDNVLTITDGGQSESFTLVGTYNQSDFVLLMDPSGGTEVVYGAEDFWKSCESGCWTACCDWCDGVPTACSTAIIDKPVRVTLSSWAEVGNLAIGACATLDIVDCGSLTVLNAIDDSGTIKVESYADIDPRLTVDGPVTVEGTGKIEAIGSYATVEFHHDQVGIFGTIDATDRGTVTFDGSLVWNEGGKIEASHDGEVFFRDATVTNEFGATIEAKHDGTVSFDLGTVDNENCAVITADGCGSTVKFSGDDINNWGSIAAAWGGAVLFACATVDNSRGATIEADGRGSTVVFADSLVDNWGRIEAEHRGTVVFDDSQIDNKYGTIKANGWGSEVSLDCDHVYNSGLIEAAYRGAVVLDDTRVDNDGGTIEALGWNSTVDIDHSAVFGGTLLADGGKIVVDRSHVSDSVNVEITGGGIIDFAGRLNTDATITFGVDGAAGAGTLEIDQRVKSDSNVTVPATVVNFGTDDVIDLTKIKDSDSPTVSWVENVTDNGGTLTVTDATTGVAVNFTLGLAADTIYTTNDFALLSDPWGGTEVVYAPNVDTWSGDGTSWSDGNNWGGVVPGAADTAEIVTSSGATVTLDAGETVGNLVIGAGDTLDIVNSGSLVVLNALEVSGKLEVDDASSQFQVDGPVRVDGGGEMEATGVGATLVFSQDQVGNAGEMLASCSGAISFEGSDVWNEVGGTIEAANCGEVAFADGALDNAHGAIILADGEGSTVTFNRDDIDNAGRVKAEDGGHVSFDYSNVDNEYNGKIVADGSCSTVELYRDDVDNAGRIVAKHGGEVSFFESQIDNEPSGTIRAAGSGSTVKFDRDHIDNSGLIEARHGGTVWIDHSVIDNWWHDRSRRAVLVGRSQQCHHHRRHAGNEVGRHHRDGVWHHDV